MPFSNKPVLEARILYCEAIEKIALVESHCSLQGLLRSGAQQVLENCNVHSHGSGVERDGMAVRHNHGLTRLMQAPP